MIKLSKERNNNYDLIRVIAIILVMFCHSLESVYFGIRDLSFQSRIFYLLFHSISRLGVPLFLFLTGALLLNKKFDDIKDIKHFYKHNLLNLIIVCLIWYLLYYLLDIYVFRKIFLLKDFIPVLFFLKQYPLSHAWYLPMIVGIYITLPFISIIVKKYEKPVKYIMYLNIFYMFIIPMINTILQLLKVNYQIVNMFSMPFAGGCYGVYILLGYFISKNFNNKNYNEKFINCLLAIMSIISILITTYIRYRLNCDSWYNMLTILFSSSCIYTLLLRVKNIKFSKYLVKLSICSFGVYLIHKPVIDLISKLNLINATSYILPIKCIIYLLSTTLISYIIVILLSKIKYLRKYIFFIK